MESSYAVIVPCFRCRNELGLALEGLLAAGVPADQIVVVDDASNDGTPEAARALGVRLRLLEVNVGPAEARNLGAELVTQDILIFVDADVVVHPSAIRQLVDAMKENVAVFGSYDATPRSPGRVSRIRNLLHHWTHQTHRGPIASFWTGLGAIRRDVFEGIGGFDKNIDFMEDIDLGIRLWRSGHHAFLAPEIQGTHLKHWSIRSMLRTDLWARAVPWSRLMLRKENKDIPTPLTAGRTGQLSVLLVAVSLIALLGISVSSWAIVFHVLSITGLFFVHRKFFAFLKSTKNGSDRPVAFCVIWLVYLMAGLGFSYALVEHLLRYFKRNNTPLS